MLGDAPDGENLIRRLGLEFHVVNPPISVRGWDCALLVGFVLYRKAASDLHLVERKLEKRSRNRLVVFNYVHCGPLFEVRVFNIKACNVRQYFSFGPYKRPDLVSLDGRYFGPLSSKCLNQNQKTPILAT